MTRTRKAPTVRLTEAQCHAVLMLMQESDSIWDDTASEAFAEILAHGSAFGGTDPDTWPPRVYRSLGIAARKVGLSA